MCETAIFDIINNQMETELSQGGILEMYNFKISKISTNFGDVMEPKKVNVIIGPNNSGKSQFLKDIKNMLDRTNHAFRESVLIDYMDYNLPKNTEEFITRYGIKDRLFKKSQHQCYIRNFSGINNYMFQAEHSFDNYLNSGNINIGCEWETELHEMIDIFNNSKNDEDMLKRKFGLPEDAVIYEDKYAEYQENGQTVKKYLSGGRYSLSDDMEHRKSRFIEVYGPIFMSYLGTEEKLLLCKKQKAYGLEDDQTNFLSEIQFDGTVLEQLSKYTKKLFNKDIFLDNYTGGSSIMFRTGEDFEFIRQASRTDRDSEKQLKNYNLLDNEGDGLKGFVTNFLSLNLSNKNILLLDEPEAFLHPPLARQLGELIGEAESEQRQIFVVTHSVELLKGILSKANDVNIIRVTRTGNSNKFTQIQENVLKGIMENPLLKVSRVMEGLFCERVVITEAEADELIYQELITKLFSQSGLYFTHGHSKQMCAKIAQLYKTIGVKYEMIFDFDIMRKPDEFKTVLSLTSYSEKEKQKIKAYSEKIKNVINDSVKILEPKKDVRKAQKKKRDDVYHKEGVSFFNEFIQLKIRKTLSNLSNENIHILECGELETILRPYELDYKDDKREWVVDAIH